MGRWGRAAAASVRIVSDRPELWLPGALAWLASVGWIPFVAAVARPPTAAELTFLGVRVVRSGAWPWNAVLIGIGIIGVIVLAIAAAAAGNAVLIAMLERRRASAGDGWRLMAIDVVAAVPAALSLLVVLLALVAVAPREFNAPDPEGGEILRTALRLLPYLALFGLTAAAGAALASVAGRVAGRGRGLRRALRAAPGLALHPPLAAHAVLGLLVALLYLAFAAILLGVLWAPIGARLESGGQIDFGTGLLLLGFVAIWLCVLLAGGAVHAWSAATWSRLIATEPSGRT